MIGDACCHKVRVSKTRNWAVGLASRILWKVSGLDNKAFGNMSYDQSMSRYDFAYQVVGFEESIKRTEG